MAFGRRYCGRDVAMKSPLSFFARGVVGVFFAVCVCGGAAAKDVYTLNAASSKFYVVDGDTVHYGRLKIRLCGIQAPEKYAPRPYKMTTKMLRQIIGRKKIHAHIMTTDKYKRKVAVLFIAGDKIISVNERMVRRGGAKHYRRFSQSCEPLIPRARLDAAEARAKKSRKGIWRR